MENVGGEKELIRGFSGSSASYRIIPPRPPNGLKVPQVLPRCFKLALKLLSFLSCPSFWMWRRRGRLSGSNRPAAAVTALGATRIAGRRTLRTGGRRRRRSSRGRGQGRRTRRRGTLSPGQRTRRCRRRRPSPSSALPTRPSSTGQNGFQPW